jgi:hypothetical protein
MARLPHRLRRQMLAGAEADLEPDRLDRAIEQPTRIDRPLARQFDPQPRQQRVEKLALSRAELAAATAAVQERPARAVAGIAQNTARSCGTRSRRSHEKPPSASGARPKCP